MTLIIASKASFLFYLPGASFLFMYLNTENFPTSQTSSVVYFYLVSCFLRTSLLSACLRRVERASPTHTPKSPTGTVSRTYWDIMQDKWNCQASILSWMALTCRVITRACPMIDFFLYRCSFYTYYPEPVPMSMLSNSRARTGTRKH